MKNNRLSKLTACFTAALLIINSSRFLTDINAVTMNDETVSMEQLETQKTENNEKIQELQASIKKAQEQYDTILQDENAKAEYKNALNEKILLQNQNIDCVTEQILQLDSDINDNITKINDLDTEIKINNENIRNNKDLLKQQMRAQYMTGGSDISAIFVGSTSFHDVLTKFELFKRIAEHDADLIETLDSQLKKFNELKAVLEEQQHELNENLINENQKKEELTDALEVLSADYVNTQNELARLGDVKTELALEIEDSEEELSAQEEELKMIARLMAEFEEKLRKESISASVSESIKISQSVSASESISVSESIAAAHRPVTTQPPVTQSPVVQNTPAPTQAPVVSQAPVETAPPETQPAPPPETAPPVQTEPPAPVQTDPPVTETQPPATTPAPAPVIQQSSGGMIWPVPSYGKVESEMGNRWNRYHKGIDITASDGGTILGKTVVASSSGTVIYAVNSCPHNYGKSSSCGCGGGYGRYVVIRHDDGSYATLYAHLTNAVVSMGQHVEQGQSIGYVGSTGDSRGPHLHYEIHVLPFTFDKDNVVNPLDHVSSPY